MRFVMLFVAGALAVGPVAAGTIYKSVDRDGRVTYAAQPLPDAVSAEPLVPDAPPNEEQVRQAQEQAEAIASFNERRDRERREAAREEADRRATAGQTIIVERPYLVPVPYGDRWWGVPVMPPDRPIHPPRPRPSPPSAPTPRPGGGMRR